MLIKILYFRLFFFLIFTILVKNLRCFQNFIKSFCIIDQTDNMSFFNGIKRNINKITNLEVKIYFVCKTILINPMLFNGKEIFIIQFFISTIECFRKARIFTFHQFFNTSILNNIHKHWRNIHFLCPINVWSEQCMTNFMCYQKIIHII